jgi:dihydrolipoamide dehydrogenase
VTVEGAAFDWTKVQQRKAAVVRKNTLGVASLLQKHGVEVVTGHGRLDGPGRVRVTGADGAETLLTADRIILATGSTTARLPGIEPDGVRILTSDHLLELAAVPASLVVLGAGAVGVEFADVMNAFGARVTLVEMLPRILPLEDPEVSAELTRALSRRKIAVLTGRRAVQVAAGESGVRLVLEDVSTRGRVDVEAELLLVAAGRRPLTGDLGLETVDVEVDRRGFIQTDAHLQTAVPGLYAIGDIIATPQLAHVASAEALVAVAHACGGPVAPVDYDRIPSCTYCSPEVASVGLTEEEAARRGHRVEVGRFPFAALGKAAVLNEPHGFVKVVADAESGRPLGVHMIGPHVTDLVAGAGVALELEGGVAAWSRVVHPHPTLSEAVLEAVQAVLGEAVHG